MIRDLQRMDKTAINLISDPPTNGQDSASDSRPIWMRELSAALRSPDQLLSRLQLPSSLSWASSPFPLLVPESFVRRMEPGNPDDPLLKQVLPDIAEANSPPGFSADPVGDQAASPIPGLIHKYTNRVLIITTGQCAVHCRYCFRREFPYEERPPYSVQWDQMADYLEAHPEVSEVILSGGDPLTLSDSRLQQLIAHFEPIGHLKRLRIHTRLPIVLPSRITDRFLDLLQESRLQPFVVVHANHPNELVDDCSYAITKLVRSGIPVLNQAVLLKGINDNLPTLQTLCERLINLGVTPYYLNQLDRVNGSAHFEVDDQVGIKLIDSLKATLPGYAVPKFVVDLKSGESKTELRKPRAE